MEKIDKSTKNPKPLGGKAYGSIGHLPGSLMANREDRGLPDGQVRMLTEKPRGRNDIVIVTEKLDGSCVSVARIGGELIPLTKAGYVANTSPFEHLQLFYRWAMDNRYLFAFLREGERIVGEWLALVHGTRYDLKERSPLVVFDLFNADGNRYDHYAFRWRTGHLARAPQLYIGSKCCLASALERLGEHGHYGAIDSAEGVVYRLETPRKTGCGYEVEFLGKFVRRKIDEVGRYLPEVSGRDAVWNWRPETA